ncbi:nucleolar [Halobellus salinus]|uniref:Nucleolar n=1 Tax=Halobellus salinus TaxID=931585 RepID=A0A830ECY0_9EURY|nr:NOP5/NOP56 family protein [Halobellus salinus]GGJ11972.1 nucleolar [Halobellus salinus]SMP02925.1 rRNA biogenesis protein Nop56/Nop58 [Halobellus salinus]
MTGHNPGDSGWFRHGDPHDAESAATAIRERTAEQPQNWPAEAVRAGFVENENEYYDTLYHATVHATRAAVQARETATERQLQYSIAAMDDAERTANEIAERVAEWAGSLADGRADGDRASDLPGGIDGARAVAAWTPETPAEERVVSLAERAADLDAERAELRSFVESQAPAVAPNLAEMAGPVLAARLLSLAGGLESLAKKPAGTVQVLGAEDALFAHLRGRGPSPKHGAIFTHEHVRGTHPENRGSAARALAGKLAIAARIDHYAGDFRQSVHDDLADRMAVIRAREVGE